MLPVISSPLPTTTSFFCVFFTFIYSFPRLFLTFVGPTLLSNKSICDFCRLVLPSPLEKNRDKRCRHWTFAKDTLTLTNDLRYYHAPFYFSQRCLFPGHGMEIKLVNSSMVMTTRAIENRWCSCRSWPHLSILFLPFPHIKAEEHASLRTQCSRARLY